MPPYALSFLFKLFCLHKVFFVENTIVQNCSKKLTFLTLSLPLVVLRGMFSYTIYLENTLCLFQLLQEAIDLRGDGMSARLPFVGRSTN